MQTFLFYFINFLFFFFFFFAEEREEKRILSPLYSLLLAGGPDRKILAAILF